MLEKIIFTEAATTAGGRSGHTETADGQLKFEMRLPKAMGGPGGGTNPEQLFACVYSACFGGAVDAAARQKKVSLPQAPKVTANVSLGNDVKGGYGIAVELQVRMPGVGRRDAEAVLEAAHQMCPYSKATRGNIDVTLTLVD